MCPMYIHEQMASPSFNNICCAVSEEWTQLPLAAFAESVLLYLLNIRSYRQDNSHEKHNNVPRITAHSFQIGQQHLPASSINDRFYMATNLFYRKSIMCSNLVWPVISMVDPLFSHMLCHSTTLPTGFTKKTRRRICIH